MSGGESDLSQDGKFFSYFFSPNVRNSVAEKFLILEQDLQKIDILILEYDLLETMF